MSPNPSTVKKTDIAGIAITILVLVWTVGVTAAIQLWALYAVTFPDQVFQTTSPGAPVIYFGAALVQTLALLLPLVPLASLWRTPRYRAAFRTWFAATCFLLLLSPTRLVPSTMPQLALLLQLLLALSFIFVLWWRTGRGVWLGHAAIGALAISLTLGILLMIPWVLWGALGSIGDVIFGILASLAVAVATTLIITRVWLVGIAQDTRGAGWDITFGGFVLGAMLLLVGSAIGFSGTQFWFMLALSAFGWLLMVLVQVNFRDAPDGNGTALFVLVFLAVLAPLLFTDPTTGILLASFGEGEVLGYVIRAATLVVLGAWGLGTVLFFLRHRLRVWQGSALALSGAGIAALAVLLLYFTSGQPGLYGSRVFVIMKAQADTSAVRKITNYTERRASVYNTLTKQAEDTQSDLSRSLDQFGIPYTPYYLENAIEVAADLPVQWWLGTRSDVDRVLPAPYMRPLPEPPPVSRGERTTPPTSPEWNLTLIGADRVWKELGVRGAGVIVGQSDSGVQGTHPELAAQYRGHDGSNDYNWLDPWNHSTSPQDIGGHGTHTLGSVLGKNVGVAPDAQWYGCVNLARNLGSPPRYLDCMQFMLAPFPQGGSALRDGDPTRGAMVLNNSWGCPDFEGCDPNTLLAAVEALRDAGVFVVASAGNDGPACSSINAPLSLYDGVFSVGAVDKDKLLAGFSSRGPVNADRSGRIKPDISAPGVDVLSSFPGDSYATLSGTSMAGPHIAGVVALMWSANPKLIGDIDRTEQILRETAQPASAATEKIVCGDPTATPNDFFGYGTVDAYAAVKRALAGN